MCHNLKYMGCGCAMTISFCAASMAFQSAHEEEQQQKMATPRWTMQTTDLSTSLSAEWEKEGVKSGVLWTFRSRHDVPGLEMIADNSGQKRTVVLEIPGTSGPVVQVMARSIRLGRTKEPWYMIVVALASLTKSEQEVEYRMIVRHCMDPLIDEKNWIHSGLLLRRPIEKRLDGISISFPGGDSVALGLHDLTRGGDRNDEIESHYFVNHCPGGAMDMTTEHYVSRVIGGANSLFEFRNAEDRKENGSP